MSRSRHWYCEPLLDTTAGWKNVLYLFCDILHFMYIWRSKIKLLYRYIVMLQVQMIRTNQELMYHMFQVESPDTKEKLPLIIIVDQAHLR